MVQPSTGARAISNEYQTSFLQQNTRALLDQIRQGIEKLGGRLEIGSYTLSGQYGPGIYLSLYHPKFASQLNRPTGELEAVYLDKDCQNRKDFLNDTNCDLAITSLWLQDKLPPCFPSANWHKNTIIYPINDAIQLTFPIRKFYTPPSIEKPEGEFDLDRFYTLYNEKKRASCAVSNEDAPAHPTGKITPAIQIDPRKF